MHGRRRRRRRQRHILRHVAHTHTKWRLSRHVCFNLDPLSQPVGRREGDARKVRHQRALVVAQGLIDQEAAGHALVVAVNDEDRAAKCLREFDETAFEFQIAVAVLVAREAQPRETIGPFVAFGIRIALNEDDDRARIAPLRKFRCMFEPERIRHDAVFELAVASARGQIVIVRRRHVEPEKHRVADHPAHIFPIRTKP